MIGYSKTAQCGPKKISVTQRNIDANKKLDAEYAARGIDFCELHLSNQCLVRERYSYGELLKLTYAHRHKRIWYRDKPELLYSFMQTLKACIPCHQMIEHDPKLTYSMFAILRNPLLVKAENMTHNYEHAKSD